MGDWETGRLGDGETGRLGDWETGRRGDWETGRRGDEETERWGDGVTEKVANRKSNPTTLRQASQGSPGSETESKIENRKFFYPGYLIVLPDDSFHQSQLVGVPPGIDVENAEMINIVDPDFS